MLNATRIALFFSAASLSGAFSGLLAAAIENMNGMRGRPGWAWIFILVCLTYFIPSIRLNFFNILGRSFHCPRRPCLILVGPINTARCQIPNSRRKRVSAHSDFFPWARRDTFGLLA